MNILVLQLKRIGDLVLTFPALAALRAARPEARITLVTAGAANGLAELAPGVEQRLGYVKRRPNLGLWRRLLGSKFDLCLDFTGSDRSALMASLSRARQRATYQKWALRTAGRRRLYDIQCEAQVRDLHTVDFHHALLEAAGIVAEPAALSVAVPESAAARAADLCPAGSFALIHAGTAREEKYWPAERWAEVIDALDLPVVLTGADDAFERAHLEQIKTRARREVVDLSGRLSLAELAAVIERSAVAIGVDTAAMHLAACLERPQVVLFGPTNPFHWRPRHSRAAVVMAGQESPLNSFTPRHEAAPMDELSTAAVIRAIGSVREGVVPPR